MVLWVCDAKLLLSERRTVGQSEDAKDWLARGEDAMDAASSWLLIVGWVLVPPNARTALRFLLRLGRGHTSHRNDAQLAWTVAGT